MNVFNRYRATPRLLALAFALTLVGVTAWTAPPAAAQDVAFEGVRLFDGEQLVERATVVVRDGIITAVGPDVAVPEGVPVLGGAGRTLLPGLIDAHTHTFAEDDLRTALAFGVTTELDQFGESSFLRRVTADQDTGQVTDRADLFGAGIVATAPGGHGTQYGMEIPTLDSPGQAPSFVDDRIAEGSRWIKIIRTNPRWPFPTLDLEVIGAVIDAAHDRGVMAVVHISTAEDAVAVAELGADGIAHTSDDGLPDDEFGPRYAATGAFVVSTLTVLRAAAGGDEGARQIEDPALAPYLDASQRRSLSRSFPLRPGAERGWEYAAAAMRALRAAGVPILAGSDAPNPATAHGVTLHRELRNLVASGLTPLEALTAATSAPADAFGLSDRGRIAPGLVADLLLVAGDPTADVKASADIVGVWKRGVRFDREIRRQEESRGGQGASDGVRQ